MLPTVHSSSPECAAFGESLHIQRQKSGLAYRSHPLGMLKDSRVLDILLSESQRWEMVSPQLRALECEDQYTKAFPPIHQWLLLFVSPNQTAHPCLQISMSYPHAGRFYARYMFHYSQFPEHRGR